MSLLFLKGRNGAPGTKHQTLNRRNLYLVSLLQLESAIKHITHFAPLTGSSGNIFETKEKSLIIMVYTLAHLQFQIVNVLIYLT